MDIVGYVKEHPYASGTILIVGGLVFYLIVAGGSSSPQVVNAGPSEAEIMADASIKQAQISANAAASEAAAAVKAAEIGAGVKLKSDELAAQTAITALGIQKNISLGVATIESGTQKYSMDSTLQLANINAATTQYGINADLTRAGMTLEAQKHADYLAAQVALTESENTKLMFDKAQDTVMTLSAYQTDTMNRSIAAGVETQRMNNETLVTTSTINANTLLESTRLATEADKVVAGINASTINNLTNASIMKDQIGADITKYQINKNAATITNLSKNESAVRLAEINKDTTLGQGIINVQNNAITANAETQRLAIEASKTVGLAEAQSAENIQQARLTFAKNIAPDLKKKDRDDVAQAAITGETYYKQNTTSTIQEIGQTASGVGQLASSIVPFL